VQLPFLRRSPAATTVVEEPAPSDTAVRQRAHTPSKRDLGQTTPKRKVGGRVVQAPPANRREAVKRMREKDRESRAQQMAGMREGKEEFLPARDKGPERALVRDVVDSRRNLASFFLPGLLVIMVAMSGAWPGQVQLGANILWLMLILAVGVDSFVLTRQLRKALAERFPKSETPARRHYYYAIMRTFQFRRWRIPKARVNVGQSI
jgi:hypothetical protein